MNLETPLEIQFLALAGHVFPAGNAENPHLGIVPQPREELRRDEEVLGRVLTAGDFHHAFVDHALVAGVHALIDLVDDAERGLSHGLEGHEVEDGGDSALATRLAMGVELLKLFIFAARMSVLIHVVHTV